MGIQYNGRISTPVKLYDDIEFSPLLQCFFHTQTVPFHRTINIYISSGTLHPKSSKGNPKKSSTATAAHKIQMRELSKRSPDRASVNESARNPQRSRFSGWSLPFAHREAFYWRLPLDRTYVEIFRFVMQKMGGALQRLSVREVRCNVRLGK